MRPTLLELLRGARHTIDTVIAPDLRSDWSIKAARQLGALIEYLVVLHEQGPAFLSRSNERLRNLLEEVEKVLSDLGGPAPDQALFRIRAALAAQSRHDDDHCIVALMAENERLQTAVEAALLPPEDLLADENARGLSAMIQRALAEEIHEEFALIEPLMGLLRGR